MKHLIFSAVVMSLFAISSCTSSQSSDSNKDFLTVAHERYSVRHFTDQIVNQDDLDKIIEAGKIAPTAVNSQPQKIYVVNTPEMVAKLNEVSPCIYGAPQVFVFCYNDETVCQRGETGNYGDIDVTIVLTHMMLEAANLGIGSCLVGYYDEAKLIEALEIPEGIHPILIMPFGYAAEDAVPSEKHTSYRPLSETVEYK